MRFNKEGNLLAVTTMENGFKILANAVGLKTLKAIESTAFEGLRSPLDSGAIKVTINLCLGLFVCVLFLCFRYIPDGF